MIDLFATALADSIADNAITHRLWCDIRNQSLFDGSFRPIVAEIESMLMDIGRSVMTQAGHPPDIIDLP